MTKRAAWLACLAVVAAMLLGACGSSPRRPAAPLAAPVRGAPMPIAGPASGELAWVVPGATPMPSLQAAVPRRARTWPILEMAPIRYATRIVQDGRLFRGMVKVRTPGIAGSRTLTYLVTMVDGREVGRRLIASVVTRAPVTKVIVVGTRDPVPLPEYGCDANYTGACVPVASDVDCAGEGDGPAYVVGPVKVVGIDVYHLDQDGDGIGCDG